MRSKYSSNAENEAPDHGTRVLNKSRIGIKRSAHAISMNDAKADDRQNGSKVGQKQVSTFRKRTVLGDVTNQLHAKKIKLQSNSLSSVYEPVEKKVRKGLSTITTTKQSIAAIFQPRKVAPKPVAPSLSSLGIEDARSSFFQSPAIPRISGKEEHDIDSQDKKNASSCWQYAEEITKNQLGVEKDFMTSGSYMSRQRDINSKMRSILIDWLVDVHCKYDLTPHALHIAIQLIDRHLEKNLTVPRQRLQLVGVTAMFIASKYEEIYPPEAEDFVRITDNAYTRDEVFGMEEKILSSVSYRVTFPTAYHFIQRFYKASRTLDDRVHYFAHYIIDRSLQEYKLTRYRPSMIASSALYISKCQMNDFPLWNSTLEHHTSYKETDLSKCVADLREMLWNAQNGVGKTSKLSAVRRKFEKERFMGVAKLPLKIGK
uniref:Cyclin B putative n=1 Tax=Albugo laibachii Nc14 TaxID=890382 RepID=F0WV78_9STRA|nr:Cyclin B putative [Albugo laibachii Nc14]|eukprot:CCA25317.1 Cyclin B putative [Albugo laibachii Nc14]